VADHVPNLAVGDDDLHHGLRANVASCLAEMTATPMSQLKTVAGTVSL